MGDRVVVRDGASRWQADNGQYLLGLDVSVENGVLRVVERNFTPAPAPPAAAAGDAMTAADWFNEGLDREDSDPRAAIEAYERTVELESNNVAAWINWGRLLHQSGEARAAEKVYRRAIEQCGKDSVLMFNLGVLLEDLGRTGPALEAYQAAIGEDPNLADCHYNLARLYESLGKPQHAIRHFGQYRRLVSSETC